MKVLHLLVSVICIWINPTHSQFFYSHYTPLAPPIFPQAYFPPFPAAAPLAYNAPPNPVPDTSSITYNLPAIPTPEYRGFGYRTDFKDGSTSTVFYVTGAEAQNLVNFKDFPNFTRRTQEQETSARGRSLASDITDTNAIPDAEGKIQTILRPHEFDRLFDNINVGLVNFYSYPAGTAPLAERLANLTANATTTTTTTTTTPSSDTEETVAAESLISPKVVVNEVEDIIKNNASDSSTTTTSTTTESNNSSSSEATPSTTTQIVEKNEDNSSASTNDETTVETTTIV